MLTLTLLLLALLITCGVRWWLDQHQIHAQLATHKMMLPAQIRGARRVYVRGLYRQTPRVNHWRYAAMALWVLAGLLAFYGAMGLLEQANQTSGLLPLTFGTGSADAAEIGWWGAVVTCLPAALIQAYLVGWRTRTLIAANQAAGETPTDLYWTPTPVLIRLERLDWLALGWLVACLLAAAIGTRLGWFTPLG
ncbi:hypothetical protein [Lacticaseibacillus nasuensis]|uniref:hypothetical protein n=1 Tax=Lacticaseibacillus nasuensis TaxID=944671 RepID=UPI002247C191|nr:hypothetical protein [Lacticaseibacillus nasuensis]MCX2455757.1 hypothetical protein [Lacticaseibacillus nasuensis]